MMITAWKTSSAGILPAVPRASWPRRGGRGRPPDSRRDGGATLTGRVRDWGFNMSRELDAQAGVKVPSDGAAEGQIPAVRSERSPFSCPLDRRSFLQCALASGAALGVCEFTQLFVLGATPAWAGSQKQDDSRFTVEAKFYEKLP